MNHQSVFVAVLFQFKGYLFLLLSVFLTIIYIYAAHLFNIVPVGLHAFCSNVMLCISLNNLSCRQSCLCMIFSLVTPGFVGLFPHRRLHSVHQHQFRFSCENNLQFTLFNTGTPVRYMYM